MSMGNEKIFMTPGAALAIYDQLGLLLKIIGSIVDDEIDDEVTESTTLQ